ncbi:hypothetical protein B6S12_10555, partial [Helicobacter valdiviensis]
TGTNKDKNQSIYLVGDKIYIDADATNLSGNTIYATAFSKGYIQRQMNKFAKDNYQFGNYDKLITNQGYTDSNNTTTQGKDFKKAITIGNMGSAIENAKEWWYFAKSWNEAQYFDDIKTIDEFRLVGDIDFGADCYTGTCNKDKNYANYWIDFNGDGEKQENEYTNMMVGDNYPNSFGANFDGQGYTLKNINIEVSKELNYGFAGIFGSAFNGNEFKNINVDYMGGGIKIESDYIAAVGGFLGGTVQSHTTFNNITVSNIAFIEAIANGEEGAIAGIGGFLGGAFNNRVTANNITLNNIGNIKAESISNESSFLYMGGFASIVSFDSLFSNIIINGLGSIEAITTNKSPYIGGFLGTSAKGIYENIYIYFKPDSTIKVTSKNESKKYAGKFIADLFQSSSFSNIHLYHTNNQFGDLNNIDFIDENVTINGKINSHSPSQFQTDVENFFKEENDKPQIHYNKEGGYYTFLDETNNGNGGDNGSNGDNG